MAEVEYKREPTVSVHGVPQSQYNATPSTYGSGGAGGWLKGHWLWIVGGLGAVFVVYYFFLKNNNSNAYNAAIDPNTGMPVGATSPDQLWGSQLDADMQQMMSFQNQMIGILQQQQGTPTSGTGTTTTTGSFADKVRAFKSSWDSKRNRKGVPIDTSPGSHNEGTIPFGASLTVTGPAVSGPKTTHGTGMYYPVTWGGMTGFVNSIDLATPPKFPVPGTNPVSAS